MDSKDKLKHILDCLTEIQVDSSKSLSPTDDAVDLFIQIENELNRIRTLFKNLTIVSEEKTKLSVELEKKNLLLATAIAANHYINQPLTLINGNLFLLKTELEDIVSPETNVRIHLIQMALNEISYVLNRLLETEEIRLIDYLDDKKMLDLDIKMGSDIYAATISNKD